MIEHLKSLAIFATVVDAGSFRGAATRLGVSPSVVSEHISQLERELGIALLYRSTRALSLTEQGEALYPKAQSMLGYARDGLETFSKTGREKTTRSRIALPATMNGHPLVQRTAAFVGEHPGVLVQLFSSDRQADLQREGYDLAIRMGYFKDSDLKTRRIGNEPRILVASPRYLETRSEIRDPADLVEHDFVSFSLVPDSVELSRPNRKKIEIWGRTVVSADSAETVRALALTGLGLAALPYEALRADIDAGRLQRVLPDWDEKVLPISLTWPKNATLNALTRELVDYLSAA
ncbi:MAG: LysR family transcriptional regulator [Pseudomonadota bacterium]